MIKGLMLCALFFTGCMAMQQTRVLCSDPVFVASTNDRERLNLGWKCDSLKPKEQADLDTDRSFIEFEPGSRFHIKFLRNPCGNRTESNWASGFLMLFQRNDHGDLEQVRWTNGRWHLHLEFTKKVKKEPIDVDIKISTF